MKFKAIQVQVFAILVSACCATAIWAAKKPAATFVPTVSSVSADSITVKTGAKAGPKVTRIDSGGGRSVEPPTNEKTYRVLPSTAIKVNGLASSLSVIKPGMQVQVTQGVDQGSAASISASDVSAPTPTPPVQPSKTGHKKGKGQIQLARAILPEQILALSGDTITVAAPGGLKAKSYRITAATAITVNGAKASIESLQKGMNVRVTGDFANTASSIEAAK